MAFPVKIDKKKEKPKDAKEKKNSTYLADDLHMTEYAWVGDHPIGPIPKEKEEEEEAQEGNFTMGQSGG